MMTMRHECRRQAAILGGNPTDKDVLAVIDAATKQGWRYERAPGRSAHPAGHLKCPHRDRNGCRFKVLTTPKGDSQSRVLKRQLRKCPHGYSVSL